MTDREDGGGRVAYPDTLVGTDSHTTMVNGLGVLGYGVGGIEAEAVLLGQPLYQPMPRIVGVRLPGGCRTASTATDLVLVITEMLRSFGVVGLVRRVRGRRPRRPFARRPGDDLEHEPRVRRDRDAVPDRRRDAVVPAAHGSDAGARRPRRALREGPGPVARARRRARVRRRARARPRHRRAVARRSAPAPGPGRAGAASARASAPPSRRPTAVPARPDRRRRATRRRSATARWRSRPSRRCTNTSNPTVMVGAGLLARNAVARGLHVSPTVKTSLAPGSKAVTGYLEKAGLWSRWRRSASRSPATAARPASATPARWPSRSRRPSNRTSWSSRRSCRATATSRAGSTRWCGPPTSPRRRWSSPSRWPAGSTST